MARRTTSRLELRKQAEAAESMGIGDEVEVKKKDKATKEPAAKKKPASRAKRTKVKAIVRKRLVWGVFSPSLKEEGRFPYDQQEAAEARATELAQKHKRLYFVQAIKEVLSDKPEHVMMTAAPVLDDEILEDEEREEIEAEADEEEEEEVEVEEEEDEEEEEDYGDDEDE